MKMGAARVGRNNQRALRRMLASHPVQCATLIAPYTGCDIEQVYLCREPIDFRKSINGLSVLVEQEEIK